VHVAAPGCSLAQWLWTAEAGGRASEVTLTQATGGGGVDGSANSCTACPHTALCRRGHERTTWAPSGSVAARPVLRQHSPDVGPCPPCRPVTHTLSTWRALQIYFRPSGTISVPTHDNILCQDTKCASAAQAPATALPTSGVATVAGAVATPRARRRVRRAFLLRRSNPRGGG